jgi:hypothetical protein
VGVVHEKLAYQLGAARVGETGVGTLAAQHRHYAAVVLFLGAHDEVEVTLMERAELPHTQSYSHDVVVLLALQRYEERPTWRHFF